jgi:Mg2+-importing ATPase
MTGIALQPRYHAWRAHPAPEVPAASPLLAEMAGLDIAGVFGRMESSAKGVTSDGAARRLEKYGPNQIAGERRHGWPWRLLCACRNPLVILLSVLAAVSCATGDTQSAALMLILVVIGVLLRFVQESRADLAAAKLRAMIRITATVWRDGAQQEVSIEKLVPGDVVTLTAGDMIPADVRLISAKDLFVIQSSLTGESLPVEKSDAADARVGVTPIERSCLCFLGTSVERGAASAIVLETGSRTYLGQISHSLATEAPPTSFEKGISSFTWLMIYLMAIMVPIVFVVNGVTKHNWREAFFFSLAVAVGLTPEMLPMIVSVCLSKGAIAMSRKKVIVKRLAGIQNLGAMDVLCTDKTGTLTLDRVILERYCDVSGNQAEKVLIDAYLVSHFQTGLKSVMDRAVLDHGEKDSQWSIDKFSKIDEIPFDFSRRIMSVVVRDPGGKMRLLAKGAPEELMKRCSGFELNGEVLPIDNLHQPELEKEYESLSADGFRVLAIASREVPEQPGYSVSDEKDLVLSGYLAFLDPPKETAGPAIAALRNHGIAVKVLSGDNALVCRKICHEVGLSTDPMLRGSEIEQMSDEELSKAVQDTLVFARVSPGDKERIIQCLRKSGHVVGYLGDGINDAPALHAADVGISVEGAVDVAREAADMILLEKSLLVVDDGVFEGRKVFANIVKYIRMGASSNFGNMFSVLGASAFLPFLPMKPLQVLVNDMLYDFSQIPIPTDDVDPEQVARPQPWSIDGIRRYILLIGPISSIFDYTTFFLMLYAFGCWNPAKASLFQTGWFVESLMTQTLIIHVIRTNHIPFIQSRASWPLTITSVLIMAVAGWLPYSPLASMLGFVPLPALYWPALFLTLICYLLLTQAVKMLLIRWKWI